MRHGFRTLIVAAVLGGLLWGATPVRAQMVGVADQREVFAIGAVGLVIDDLVANPPWRSRTGTRTSRDS
jgi:hypothetical protein